MRGNLTRMMLWGATIAVLFQTSALAEDSAVLPPSVEPPIETPLPATLLPVAKARPLFQHTTYPAAWRAAQKSNRPI